MEYPRESLSRAPANNLGQSDVTTWDQNYSQTYITELLPSFYLKFSLSSGGFGGVGPVAHLEAPGHGLVVHDSLGAELLALCVADYTEIFSIPQGVLRPVTHRALRPQHLKYGSKIEIFLVISSLCHLVFLLYTFRTYYFYFINLDKTN